MIYEELYLFDENKRAQYGVICGVDEAGRGPLVGPVAVSSVILNPGSRFEWLNDSKKVTEIRRTKLYKEIIENAIAFHVELIDNHVIDELNILGATMLGMKKCIEAIKEKGIKCALIDGNRVPVTSVTSIPIVKGDSLSASIAAASVLAKVTRDRYMIELSEKYPQYHFEKHKGYPTKEHYEAIKLYGITPYHRLSFLKNLESH